MEYTKTRLREFSEQDIWYYLLDCEDEIIKYNDTEIPEDLLLGYLMRMSKIINELSEEFLKTHELKEGLLEDLRSMLITYK